MKINTAEIRLKGCLKNRYRLTLALVVSFMITGMAFAQGHTEVQGDYTVSGTSNSQNDGKKPNSNENFKVYLDKNYDFKGNVTITNSDKKYGLGTDKENIDIKFEKGKKVTLNNTKSENKVANSGASGSSGVGDLNGAVAVVKNGKNGTLTLAGKETDFDIKTTKGAGVVVVGSSASNSLAQNNGSTNSKLVLNGKKINIEGATGIATSMGDVNITSEGDLTVKATGNGASSKGLDAGVGITSNAKSNITLKGKEVKLTNIYDVGIKNSGESKVTVEGDKFTIERRSSGSNGQIGIQSTNTVKNGNDNGKTLVTIKAKETKVDFKGQSAILVEDSKVVFEEGKHKIKGKLSAKTNGMIDITAKGGSDISSEVEALDGGTVKITLKSGGELTGKTTYGKSQNKPSGRVAREAAVAQPLGDGKVEINIEKGTWKVTDTSKVTDLKIEKEGYVVLEKEGKNLDIKKLSGTDGIFTLTVNNEQKDKSSKLMIEEASEGTHTLEFSDSSNLKNMKEGDKIDIVTAGEKAKDVKFKVDSELEAGAKIMNLM